LRNMLAMVCSVALAILAGCSTSSNPGEGVTSMASKVSSAIAPDDPWALFARMSEAQKAATSYRMKMVSDAQGKQFEMESELLCPSRSHSRMSVSGQVVSETYLVDGTTYMVAGGRSMKTPSRYKIPGGCPGAAQERAAGSDAGSMISSLSMKDTAKSLAEMQKAKERTKVTKGGTAVVEGATCQIWDIAYTDDANKISNIQYCIGSDNLPRRAVMGSADDQGKAEITWWDWNSKSIVINPPQ